MCLAGAWRWAFGGRPEPPAQTEAQPGNKRQAKDRGKITKIYRRQSPRQVHKPFLQLVEQLVEHVDQISDFTGQLERTKERAGYHQEEADRRSNAISRLSGDRRADHSAFLARLETELEHHQAERLASGSDMIQLRHQIRESESLRESVCKQLSRVAQAYVDACFDVDFEAPWALQARCCGDLMRWAHRIEQLQSTQREKLGLDVQRVVRRAHRRQAGLDGSKGVPTKGGLESNRQAGSDDSDDENVRAITEAELTLELQSQSVEKLQAGLLGGCLRPLLVSHQAVQPEQPESRKSPPSKTPPSDAPSDRSRKSQSVRQPPSTPVRRSKSLSRSPAPSQQHIPRDASVSQQARSDSSVAQLIEEYLDWRAQADEELVYLCEFDLAQREDLSEHLLLFSNSTPERFAHMMDKSLQMQLRRYRAVQERMMDATQALVNAGIEIPVQRERTPGPENASDLARSYDRKRRSSDGGKDDVLDSPPVKRTVTRRLAHWRVEVEPRMGSGPPPSRGASAVWSPGA